MRPDTVSQARTLLAIRAGFKVIRFHDARHSHASLLLRQGAHPRVVQERLGHSTIATTLDVYSYVTPSIQEAVAVHFDEAMSSKYNDHSNSDNKLVAKGNHVKYHGLLKPLI